MDDSAVPPLFAAPSRERPYRVRTKCVDTLPFLTGGTPAGPTRRMPFRRRLFARIHGLSRLPCTGRQFSCGMEQNGLPFLLIGSAPLLFRSHGLFIYEITLQYNLRSPVCQAKKPRILPELRKTGAGWGFFVAKSSRNVLCKTAQSGCIINAL